MSARNNIGYLNPPLTARDGRCLQVLIPCRVSSPGPGKQDIRSNDDQEAQLRSWLSSITDLSFNITILAGSGSGESLERDEYLRLIELVETNQLDLVLTEDLGRIVRRIHAHLLAELCVDHDVRLIAVNDSVDTAQDGWQDRSIFSAWHHERSNRDTSHALNGRIEIDLQMVAVSAVCLMGTARSRAQNGYGRRKAAGSQSDL